MRYLCLYVIAIVLACDLMAEISSSFMSVRKTRGSNSCWSSIPMVTTDTSSYRGLMRQGSRGTMMMAMPAHMKPRTQNVPGNLFVDEGCIDCDVCRWMCPATFARKGIKSAVIAQPATESDKLLAYAASVACPTGSSRTRLPDPLMKKALTVFPAEIDPVNLPNVFHMGFHSSPSYGATSYFIKRTIVTADGQSKAANIMIDVPRFNSRLANIVEEEGGIDKLIITHRDNFPGHEKWKERFPSLQRIIHRADAMGTASECEVKLDSGSSWQPSNDVRILHTPGHTAGSICIQVSTPKDTVLFTGDHLAYTTSKNGLDGFKRYNQGNIAVQSSSIRLLADDSYPFTWILPAHGRMAKFSSVGEKNAAVLAAASAFDREDEMDGLFAVGYY